MIRHLEQISGTDYMLPALEAWCETQRAGHGNPRVLSISWDNRVSVLLAADGSLQSMIVWTYTKWTLTASITVGWTAPAFRKQGLYTRLYKAVKKEAKKLGAKSIDGGIDPSNAAMLATANKQGRKAQGIWYAEDI